jgi:mRNA-capping enzyme
MNPTELIGIHCTHGFNRTGFLICSYLVEKLDYSIDMAVALFADSRPPGIYKEQYILELFTRYADPSLSIPSVPGLPTWDSEDADLVDDDGGEEEFEETNDADRAGGSNQNNGYNNNNNNRQRVKRLKKEESKLNPQFAEPTLRGVEACIDVNEISRVRLAVQAICGWNGFVQTLIYD